MWHASLSGAAPVAVSEVKSRAAGLPDDLQFRDLRSTAATELSDAGADPIGLSTHTGHQTVSMTRRYARRTPEQFTAAAEKRMERRKNT